MWFSQTVAMSSPKQPRYKAKNLAMKVELLEAVQEGNFHIKLTRVSQILCASIMELLLAVY